MGRTNPVCIIIGCSAGAGTVLEKIFAELIDGFLIPIIIIRHRMADSSGFSSMADLKRRYEYEFREPSDKELLEPGVIYYAPTGYHLFLEKECTFALSIGEKVNYNRPSIDLFLESAAHSVGCGAAVFILSGANNDGALGLAKIIEAGGLGIVQDPGTAEFPQMPQAAIDAASGVCIIGPEEIAAVVNKIQIERSFSCLK